MTSLAERPLFGDIYTSTGNSYFCHAARAVRVVGWTSKMAIVEEVPFIREQVMADGTQSTNLARVDAQWLVDHPLPERPVTRTGHYTRLKIEPRYRVRVAENDTLQLRDPAPLGGGQIFTRCDNIMQFLCNETQYH